MKSPHIFTGLLIGAMLPYLLIFNLIKSTRKVAPVFGYDLRQQIDEIPAMGEGKIDPDFLRTNQLFSFQCMTRIKRFSLLVINSFNIVFLSFFDNGTWCRSSRRFRVYSGYSYIWTPIKC